MILVHHIFQEIVDIQFRATIDDGFHLVEQFVEVNALSRCDVVKSHLTVDALDDLHLQHRFLGHRAHTHIHLPLDTILLTIFLDEIHELLGIRLFHLTLTHALDILQLLERHGIIGSHLFQRHILENHVRRTFHAF